MARFGKQNKHDKKKESKKDIKAMLRNLLQGFGLRPAQFGNLIDKAIRNGWSGEQFESAVYQSPAFKHAFPGIFRPDGSLRMSPSEYRQVADSYKELAQRYGLYGELGKGRIGKLIKGNVSPTELQDRFTAIARMKEYSVAFDQFKNLVAASGYQKALTDENIYEFIMGKSPKKFYDLWESASVGTAAAGAGVQLTAAEMQDISKRLPGVQSEESLTGGFQELATKIKTLMPLSQLAGMGVSKGDLITLQFGGANQADIASRVDQIVRNFEGTQDDSKKVFDQTVEQSQERGTFGQQGAF